MRTLHLNKLMDGTIAGLSKNIGAFLAEAAKVCLEQNGHLPGVILNVSGDYSATFALAWEKSVGTDLLKNWQDTNEAVEYGATAIALLLIHELTEYTFFGRAAQMGTADYLLQQKGQPPDFEKTNPAAYLEVSGIWQETKSNTLNMRMNYKIEKMKTSRGIALTIFILVAEFGLPKAKIIKI